MLKRIILLLAALFALTHPALAQTAPAWSVDQAQSSIAFSASQSGQGFRGEFKQWSADIRFDPANLAGSKVTVTIQPGSASSGDRTRDGTLKEGDWFDVGRSPNAVFQATSFKSLGGNRYEANGTLTIKGISAPVTLPFTLDIANNVAQMKGSVSLDRFKWKLGQQTDPSGSDISRNVRVDVAVRATRK